jgi:hypothetical protein
MSKRRREEIQINKKEMKRGTQPQILIKCKELLECILKIYIQVNWKI